MDKKEDKSNANRNHRSCARCHRSLFSGQDRRRACIRVDPATGLVVEGGIGAQAEQSCRNVAAVLAAAGASPEQVIKTTCFLKDMADFAAFNGVYEKYFPSRPARSCVALRELPRGVLCEIEAIALVKTTEEQRI